MTRAVTFGSLLALIGLFWIAASVGSQETANEDVPLLSELVGKYDYAGNRSKDEAAIAAQIEATVSEMGRLSRGIAREKLEKANRIPNALEISTKGSDVILSLGSWTVTAPTDGSKRPITTPLGDKGQASFHVKTATLIQEIETRKATRINSFRSTKDGKLLMKTKEVSSKLPKPVEFGLLYKPAK